MMVVTVVFIMSTQNIVLCVGATTMGHVWLGYILWSEMGIVMIKTIMQYVTMMVVTVVDPICHVSDAFLIIIV